MHISQEATTSTETPDRKIVQLGAELEALVPTQAANNPLLVVPTSLAHLDLGDQSFNDAYVESVRVEFRESRYCLLHPPW